MTDQPTAPREDRQAHGRELQEDGVSFCIPNWNHRNFLPRSVGSALRTVHRLEEAGYAGEVIVVDDASRDGSQRAIAALALSEGQSRIHAVLSPMNQGLPATRMLGIDQARFKWICLLDADNELIPDNFLDFWTAALATRASLIYGNLIVRHNGEAKNLISNDYIQDSILVENYVDAFCLLDKQKFYDLGAYRTDLNTHEDWELILHYISEAENIVFVPLVVGYYYVEDASMVQTIAMNHDRFRRIFNQRRIGLPRAFKARQIYHPQIGWL